MKNKQKTALNNQEKLFILNNQEQEEIFQIPKFRQKNRINYFNISYFKNEYIKNMKTLESKVVFILQLGYFKSSFQFFSFELNRCKKDIDFILRDILDTNKEIKNFNISSGEKTGRLQRRKIIKILNFKELKNLEEYEIFLSKHIQTNIDPKLLFQLLFNYLINNKIIIPKYYIFQSIISKVIKIYEG